VLDVDDVALGDLGGERGPGARSRGGKARRSHCRRARIEIELAVLHRRRAEEVTKPLSPRDTKSVAAVISLEASAGLPGDATPVFTRIS
jgi:hypothetical protein